MTKLSIKPKLGIGKLRFGMTIDEIRKTMNEPFQSFMKTPMSTMPTDAFDESGIHVYYDNNGRCEAIELGSPAIPVLDGDPLIGEPFIKVLQKIKTLDKNVEEEDVGFTSYELCLGAYAPEKEEDETAPIEGVIIFKVGYYDD